MSDKRLSPQATVHETAEIVDCTLGEWTEIQARARLLESRLGDYSYVVHDTQMAYTTTGKFCSIAAFCRINPGNHPLDRAALHHFSYRSRMFELGEDDDAFFDWRRQHAVTLGHDVWIGHGAVVLPGVTIGTGAAVGAGSVVTRDVPPFTVVAGVPARPIRDRFPTAVRDGLLELAWWDWPREKLKSALQDFRTLGAEAFLATYRDTD